MGRRHADAWSCGPARRGWPAVLLLCACGHYDIDDWANRQDSATHQYIWPAGGRADSSGVFVMDSTIAARYLYDRDTGSVTLFWELRREDGTDDKPREFSSTATTVASASSQG